MCVMFFNATSPHHCGRRYPPFHSKRDGVCSQSMGRLPRLGRSTLTGRFVSEFWRTVLMIAGVADTPAALRHLFDDSRLSASARRFLDETAVSMRKRWLHPRGSVIQYLIKIDCDGLLPKLYGHIVVPASVMQELGHVAAPAPVRRWLARVPVWILSRAGQRCEVACEPLHGRAQS